MIYRKILFNINRKRQLSESEKTCKTLPGFSEKKICLIFKPAPSFIMIKLKKQSFSRGNFKLFRFLKETFCWRLHQVLQQETFCIENVMWASVLWHETFCVGYVLWQETFWGGNVFLENVLWGNISCRKTFCKCLKY